MHRTSVTDDDPPGQGRADDHDPLRGRGQADGGPPSVDGNDAPHRAWAADANGHPAPGQSAGTGEGAGGHGRPDPVSARAGDDLAGRRAAGRQYHLDTAVQRPRRGEEGAIRPGHDDALRQRAADGAGRQHDLDAAGGDLPLRQHRDSGRPGDAGGYLDPGLAAGSDDPGAALNSARPGRLVGDPYRGRWRCPGRGEQVGGERSGQGRCHDPASRPAGERGTELSAAKAPAAPRRGGRGLAVFFWPGRT